MLMIFVAPPRLSVSPTLVIHDDAGAWAYGLSLHPGRVMACDACPNIIVWSARRARATGRRPIARDSRHGDWRVGNR